MENVDLKIGEVDRTFWSGRKVLVTGHTGFKGSWLSIWLKFMEAEVYGFALEPPTTPSLFDQARVEEGMKSYIGDVRKFDQVSQVIGQVKPEIIFHLAAQPLVRESYIRPIETYATNILGTAHVLEAARHVSSVKAIINVTTDKCYENREWVWGYREDEALGGNDPYSSSKACSEIVTNAYRRSYLAPTGIALASARAGNVIGGGDWATDRLIPDLLRSLDQGVPALIRNPKATRPWQHVLEPLSGYLVLGQYLSREGQKYAEAWNFGPADDDVCTVEWIAEYIIQLHAGKAIWQKTEEENLHEASYLKLDSSKARARLGWRPRWSLTKSLDQVLYWHQSYKQNDNAAEMCIRQITEHNNN